ncbi:nucleolin [Exophiala viscosa]|uniref:nucleolin n=1 Tax=Exophiala viscosa TaxID=2486360 RepID=UPI00219B571F|nr:nucleolin [Exophiala viscosa]
MADTESNQSFITRIYVSGLPPSMTKEQLWSHFQGKYPVTDAHVVADRRIGFVGFQSHEHAKNAVKYFNKTFVRMSRITVTLANPIEVKRDSSGQAAPVSQRSSQRRERRQQEDNVITRKRKRETTEDGGKADLPQERRIEGPGNTTDTHPQVENPGKEEDEPQEIVPTTATEQEDGVQTTAASDVDWLRGKTSRLLDLVEDAEDTWKPVASEVDGVDYMPVDDGSDRKGEETTHVNTTSTPEELQLSIPNARLFVRNLPFDIREEDLRKTFSAYGRISEIHLVTDTRKSTGKGLGYVQYVEPIDAEKALLELDGRDFHGRLLHVLPASDKKTSKLSEFEISKLPLKKQKAIKRKNDSSKSTFSWNSLYMNPDAVLASVADRLGVAKSEVLDPASADAAVKQAHAETSVIKETKDYLRSHGINVDAFKNSARDGRTLLLKNFSYGTTSQELLQMLSQHGKIERLVFPTTGTVAVAQFQDPSAAALALKQLAYRNLGGSVLYLERAPQGLWESKQKAEETGAVADPLAILENETEPSTGTTTTLFVRNLNFSTTTARLAEAFRPLSGFLSARVKTRTDAKRPGEILSMGFGFVEFWSKGQAEAALATMNGRRFDGHEVLVQLSQKSTDMAEERRKEDTSKKVKAQKTKIIIKNLPFEASRKDIRALFGAYGQLRTVRMPKKFDNSTRGFAFAEFVTAKEAENALDALSNTHLLGRKLVLDFAEGETIDPEAEIRAMERKVQDAQDTLSHHRMTGSARKKFNVGAQQDDVEAY